MTMKVLFVTHENPQRIVGGLGTFVQSFVGCLKSWAEVRVLLIRYDATDEVAPGGLVDYVVDASYTFPACTQEAQVVDTAYCLSWKIDPILREFSPDVIHCNDRQTYLPFKHLRNVVFSLHLSVPDLMGPALWDQPMLTEAKIERTALQWAGATVVYSRFMAGRVRKMLGSGGNLCCLPLGTDQGFKPRENQPDNKKIVISFFGRLEDRQKGVREFVAAVGLLDAGFIENHGLEFRIYGRGEPWDWSPLPVKYCGFVEGEDRRKAFEEADIVVFPSRYEPFGLVGLEALAANALLLAPCGQGMDEYFSPGANGVAILPEAEDIAKKLESVVGNWPFYSRLRLSSAASVARYTWTNSVQAHLQVYRQVAGLVS